MTKPLSLLICLALISSPALAKRKQHERAYQEQWCKSKGQTEVRQSDRTRVDCLTATHAIEFDFANKWAESIGQALGYAMMTSKRAGVVLIVEDKKNYTKWLKLNSVIMHHKLPIDTWIITAWD